jgi:hypothetical protein
MMKVMMVIRYLGVVEDALPVGGQLFVGEALLGRGGLVPRRSDGHLAHKEG